MWASLGFHFLFPFPTPSQNDSWCSFDSFIYRNPSLRSFFAIKTSLQRYRGGGGEVVNGSDYHKMPCDNTSLYIHFTFLQITTSCIGTSNTLIEGQYLAVKRNGESIGAAYDAAGAFVDFTSFTPTVNGRFPQAACDCAHTNTCSENRG